MNRPDGIQLVKVRCPGLFYYRGDDRKAGRAPSVKLQLETRRKVFGSFRSRL